MASATYFVFYCLLFACASGEKVLKAGRRPNIVVIIADDLGYGDLGCFGNRTILTPNLDRLAEKGAKLTHVLAASAVCTPSRAALLTGRYPRRSGLAPAAYPVNIFAASPSGLSADETTFAKILQSSGYATALIGKWHLGWNCYWYGDNCHHPSVHGFDHFYGLPLTLVADFLENPKTVTIERLFPNALTALLSTAFVSFCMTSWLVFKKYKRTAIVLCFVGVVLPLAFYTCFKAPFRLNGILLRDKEIVEQPVRLWTLARRFVHETKIFIKQQHDNDKSFMVVLSLTHVHEPLETHPSFEGKSQHGPYGDSIQELDWMVGQVVQTLEALNIFNETMVVFTSDHGAHLELEAEGSNGIFSGGKYMYGMEGGIRVPVIVTWPGRVLEGSIISTAISLMDFYPTFLEIAGEKPREDKPLDGHSILPILTRQTHESPHQFLFHYSHHDTIEAVTYIENASKMWKVHFKFPNWIEGTRRCQKICRYFKSKPNDPVVVYDLIRDPTESKELDPTSDMHKRIVKDTERAIKEHEDSFIPVDLQLTYWKTMWRPWLQPCCDFPYCFCYENLTHILD